MMMKLSVRDTAIVLVLTQTEAKALEARLTQHTGVKKSKALERVEQKLAWDLVP